MTSLQKILTGIAGSFILLGGVATWFLLPDTSSQTSADNSGNFGASDNRITSTGTIIPAEGDSNNPASSAQNTQKIFKIADGPIAGATFIQTLRPTTTLARYVKADNGHVQDLVLDSPGAIPRATSNTTIPGVYRTLFAEGGNSAIVQYLDGEIIKTAHLSFPAATTTATSTLNRAVRLQFLPDGIADIAVSPLGNNIAYLLKTESGVSGYIASSNGTGSRNAFLLPLSEILISWPSGNTLLAYTKSAANYPGIAFSINVQSGAVTPLLFGQGITATADRNFSRVLYQTADSSRASYVRTIEEGTDRPLSFDPVPEKCIWSTADSVSVFCAAPLQFVPANYLDLWHQGKVTIGDAIISYNAATGRSAIVATPGGDGGGTASSIAELAISPDGRYLLYINRSDRSLWGVRLMQ